METSEAKQRKETHCGVHLRSSYSKVNFYVIAVACDCLWISGLEIEVITRPRYLL